MAKIDIFKKFGLSHEKGEEFINALFGVCLNGGKLTEDGCAVCRAYRTEKAEQSLTTQSARHDAAIEAAVYVEERLSNAEEKLSHLTDEHAQATSRADNTQRALDNAEERLQKSERERVFASGKIYALENAIDQKREQVDQLADAVMDLEGRLRTAKQLSEDIGRL